MTITILNTTRFLELNGVLCRIWEGETERGIPVMAFIPRVVARDDQDLSQFEAELKEVSALSFKAQISLLRTIR